MYVVSSLARVLQKVCEISAYIKPHKAFFTLFLNLTNPDAARDPRHHHLSHTSVRHGHLKIERETVGV
jgi:hypothetical protein